MYETGPRSNRLQQYLHGSHQLIARLKMYRILNVFKTDTRKEYKTLIE